MNLKIRFIFILNILLSPITQFAQEIVSSANPICLNTTVTFSIDGYDPSTQNLQWDFGNLSFADNVLVANTQYITTGKKTIKFSVNGSVVATKDVYVYEVNPTLTLSVNEGCEPLNVNFNTTLTTFSNAGSGLPDVNVSSAKLVTGDGTVLYLEDGAKVHTYTSHSNGGLSNYDANLIITDEFGCKGSVNKAIKVFPKPIADITTTPDVASSCEFPFQVLFTDASDSRDVKPISSWSWSFGNGASANTKGPHPTTYNADGAYTARLTVSNDFGCTDTKTLPVSIGSPTADFVHTGISQDTVCGKVYFLNRSSTKEVFWKIGTENNYSRYRMENVPYDFSSYAPGKYTVSIKAVVNNNGKTCEDIKTKTIVIPEVKADFDIVPNYACDFPFEVEFVDKSVGADTYIWDYDFSSLSNSFTVGSHLQTFDKNEIYDYTLKGRNRWYPTLTIISKYGCRDSTYSNDPFIRPDTIEVFQPNARFMPDTMDGCAPLNVTFVDSCIFDRGRNDITEYEWIFGDGSTFVGGPLDTLAKHTYTTPGVYYARLKIKTQMGCTDTSYWVPINVGDPNAVNTSFISSVADGATICPGEQIDLELVHEDQDEAHTGHFNVKNGAVSACSIGDGSPALVYAFNETGQVTISYTATNYGCYNNSTQEITINVSGPIAKCQGYYIPDCDNPLEVAYNLEFQDVEQAILDYGDGTSSVISSGVDDVYYHTYTTPGDKVFTLTGKKAGCPDYVTETIIHVRLIDAGFSVPSVVCLGKEVEFKANDEDAVGDICVNGFAWQFEQGDSIFYNPWDTLKLHILDTEWHRASDTLDFEVIDTLWIAAGDTSWFLKGDTLVDFDVRDTAWYKLKDTLWYQIKDSSWYEVGDVEVPHTYSTPGIKRVKLRRTDINGCVLDSLREIEVSDFDAEIEQVRDFSCFPEIDIKLKEVSEQDIPIVQWKWEFKNHEFNTPTVDYNPLHPDFGARNGYNISLIVTNQAGCVDTAVVRHEVHEVKARKDSINNRACLGDAIEFKSKPAQGSENTPKDYLWIVGDTDNFKDTLIGFSSDTVFQNAGDYRVRLVTVDSFGCKATSDTVDLFVQEYPQPKIIVEQIDIDNKNELCIGDDIKFIDSTKFIGDAIFGERHWNSGEGNIQIQPITAPQFSYTSLGTKTIKLTVSSSFGCEATAERDIEIVGPFAELNIDKNAICKGEDIEFDLQNVETVGKYTLVFADGATIEDKDYDSNDFPLTHTYNLHPTDGKLQATITLKSSDPTSLCEYTLDTIINVHKVIADFSRNNIGDTDSSRCFVGDNMEMQFFNTSEGITIWNFDYGDGVGTDLGASGENPDNYIYTQPGVYDVKLVAEHLILGCKDTIIKKIYLLPEPTINFPLGDTIKSCHDGLQIQLEAEVGTNATYIWSPSHVLNDPSIPNPIATLDETTTFNLQVMDPSGCTAEGELLVKVLKQPYLNEGVDCDIFGDTLLYLGESLDLTLSENEDEYSFYWTPSDYLTCDDCYNPTSKPLENIEYSVFVKDESSLECFDVEYRICIEVSDKYSLDVPTAFSPNNDGVNDIIYVDGWGIKELLSFQIFNRWGDKVFETDNLEEGWDGKYNGVLQEQDVYVYQVTAMMYVDDIVLSKKGNITLFR